MPTLTEFKLEQTSLRVDRDVRLLTSSQGLGWVDLFTAITDESPHDGLHGAIPAVWLVTAFTPNEIQRIGAGYRHERILPRNAISITGAGDSTYDEIAAPLKAVHIFLRQEIVDTVADELFKDGRGRRQIASSFGLEDAILQQLLKAISLSLNDPKPGNRLKMDYLSQALAVHLLTKHSVLGPAPKMHRIPTFNSREIGRIVDYIDANLPCNMSVAELAGLVGLGRTQFCSRFRATTSMTPHQFVITKRIGKARKLLADPRIDYMFVAELCGFASWSHFISTFKRAMSLTPHEYRQQIGRSSVLTEQGTPLFCI
jgi:AraC-like DNA-binding protein